MRTPTAEDLAEIRSLLAEHYADSSPDARDRAIRFEMGSVDEHRQNLVPLIRGHGARAGQHLLDFGSGPGCSATALATELGLRVTGIEIAAHNKPIAEAWTRAYGVDDLTDFHYATDTQILPFDDATFDFVLTSSNLEYIQGDRTPYLLEMWRVLKSGGRLIVAGTSNALYPREVHSKTWTMNWLPNVGPKLRKLRGLPEAERGVTFRWIEKTLPGARYVRGDHDEAAAFRARLDQKLRALPGPANVGTRAFDLLSQLTAVVQPVTKMPPEAYLPWLNVAFEKSL